MVRRKGKCPEQSRLESLVRAKLLVTLSPLSTLSTKFGSITFCFSFWAAASTVTKKMLIPDSLASLEASSTRSVGQPSTITTTTLGAPPRFPLASKKKFLLTNESAFPAIEEELRRSYGSGSTLIISHEIVGRELTQALEAAERWGKQFLWLCEQEGRPLLLVPVLPEPSCTEPPPYAPEGLGVMSCIIKDPQSIHGNCPQGDRYVLSPCDGFAMPGISTCRSWWEQCSLTSQALAVSTFGPSLCILWGGVGLL